MWFCTSISDCFSLNGPQQPAHLSHSQAVLQEYTCLAKLCANNKIPSWTPPSPNSLLQTAGISVKEGRIDEVGLCCAHNQLWKWQQPCFPQRQPSSNTNLFKPVASFWLISHQRRFAIINSNLCWLPHQRNTILSPLTASHDDMPEDEDDDVLQYRRKMQPFSPMSLGSPDTGGRHHRWLHRLCFGVSGAT